MMEYWRGLSRNEKVADIIYVVVIAILLGVVLIFGVLTYLEGKV